jgi:hypothetical protein
VKNEKVVGRIFHYFTGASVALTYPLVYLVFEVPVPENHLIPGLLWGLATALLPWLILFPAYGWGFFGVRSPRSVRPLLSLSVEHMVYGLGLGLVLTLVQ